MLGSALSPSDESHEFARSQCGVADSIFQTFEGYLNRCEVFDDPVFGGRVVKRTPRADEARSNALVLIERDFLNSGAIEAGIGFRLRSVSEQAVLIAELAGRGLNELELIDVTDNYLWIPFLEGVSFHIFMQNLRGPSDLMTVERVWQNLCMIHDAGFTLGDRWGPNTMILPDGRIVEFDFDIEIIAPHKMASVFEKAQFLYHTCHFSNGHSKEILKLLSRDIHARLEKSELARLKSFIGNFSSYYEALYRSKNCLLEGLVPPLELKVNEIL